MALIAGLIAVLAIACWSPASAPAPKLRSSPAQHSDLQLYRDIIAGVSAGGDYYEVAAREQRAAGYPLKPFYTFRLPTHATAYAALGERVMVVIVWLTVRRADGCLVVPAETSSPATDAWRIHVPDGGRAWAGCFSR